MKKAFLPRINDYLVLSKIAANRPKNSFYSASDAIHGVEVITSRLLKDIDRARPRYLPLAHTYLAAGHTGFALMDGPHVCAMAWVYFNSSRRIKRVSYFPLHPGEAWLHADWVAPAYRGRGLQRTLIVARTEYLIASAKEDAILVANIARDNIPSLKSYRGLGFSNHGKVKVMRWGPIQLGFRMPQ